MDKVKRLSSRKIRLPISIKLYNNGRTILSSTFYKKSAVLIRAQVTSWDKVYIKVNYGRGFYNDGIYQNLKYFKEVLSAFTEKSLLDFVEGGAL